MIHIACVCINISIAVTSDSLHCGDQMDLLGDCLIRYFDIQFQKKPKVS